MTASLPSRMLEPKLLTRDRDGTLVLVDEYTDEGIMDIAHLSDGRTVILRPMTRDNMLACGGGRCPANCEMILGDEHEPSEDFRAVTERLIAAVGTTAILATDGDMVAGFVSFFPTWCHHFDFCSDEQIAEALGHLDEMASLPTGENGALHVRCLMVRPEYQSHGLAVALLTSLKDWARAHGWQKIVGNGCIFSGRAQYQWLVSPKPPRPIWEKAGFCVDDYPALDMPAVSDAESARMALDWYLSTGYPEHLPRDVSADDPNWREIFADYTMVCRL